MICWMRKSQTNDSVLPYPVYKYNIHNNNRQYTLYHSIVSIDSVIRPACLIAHAAQYDLSWSDIGKKSLQILQKQMFYSLPYSIIIRDYCEGFVEFTGQFKNSTILQETERTSSSSRQNTSSSSRLSIFEKEMNMILSEEQIAEINNIVISSNVWNEDQDEDD